MKKESNVYKLTKIVIDLVFILGAISLFFVPYLTSIWTDLFDYSKNIYVFLTIIIVLVGIIVLYIVWNLRCILKSIVEDNPFTIDNINHLRKMALGCLLSTLIFGVKLIVKFTIPSLVLTLAFVIATLCFLTLKDLFKQALFYKEETEGVI